jgi:hypothetical protein
MKHNIILAGLNIITFYLLSVFVSQQAALAQSNFLTYNNPNLGIRLMYPADWKKSDSKDIARIFGHQMGVLFSSQPENEFDMFSENLFVGGSVVENISLAEFITSAINSLQESQNMNIADSSPTTVAGIPAYTIKYFFSMPPVPVDLFGMQIWTVKDDKLYSIIFTSQSDKFSDYEPIVQRMINSLEID